MYIRLKKWRTNRNFDLSFPNILRKAHNTRHTTIFSNLRTIIAYKWLIKTRWNIWFLFYMFITHYLHCFWVSKACLQTMKQKQCSRPNWQVINTHVYMTHMTYFKFDLEASIDLNPSIIKAVVVDFPGIKPCWYFVRSW